MTIDLMLSLLGWSAIINIGLLMWWFLWIIFAHDFIYRMHTRWFKISEEKFDAIHYSALAFYKITIIIFNVVPYLVLRFMI